MRPPDPDPLLTTSQVSVLAGVHPKTVSKWALDGLLPSAVRTPGGHRRYRLSVVRALLERQP